MAAATFPFSQNDIAGMINDGKTYLRFPLEKEEQLYGFGLNFQTVISAERYCNCIWIIMAEEIMDVRMRQYLFMFRQKDMVYLLIQPRYINVYAGSGVEKTVRIRQ